MRRGAVRIVMGPEGAVNRQFTLTRPRRLDILSHLRARGRGAPGPVWTGMFNRASQGGFSVVDLQRRVLVVDRSEDTREVLRAALERPGVRILAADRLQRGLELARRYQPEVIVLDAEVSDSPAEEICGPFAEAVGEGATALVVLGGVWRKGSERQGGEFVAKPYHYAPLIRKIEALLHATGQTVSLGSGRRV
jgi:CheY-like chemotaxis protein